MILMIHYSILSEDFIKLKIKTCGNIIQKFVNYGIKSCYYCSSGNKSERQIQRNRNRDKQR
ncbi:MAG: DUF4180 domain-containing protein [Tepidanaerobacteraceae bacterium]